MSIESLKGNEEFVFVYGTLMSGYGNNRLMTDVNAWKICGATIDGTLYDLNYFPGVRLGTGHTVYGEVWAVPVEGLASLDRLESEGFLYNRKKTEVYVDGKKAPQKTWVYEIIEQRLGIKSKVMPEGDWRKKQN